VSVDIDVDVAVAYFEPRNQLAGKHMGDAGRAISVRLSSATTRIQQLTSSLI
jgi:hypothetical protein